MAARKYTPYEFLRYIGEPIPDRDIRLWFRANNIQTETSELFFDFISYLYYLVDKTYLGADVIKTDEDKLNHFKWCWNKVINDFKKEEISFKKKGDHFQYFWHFFEESFYREDSPFDIQKVDGFFKSLFKFGRMKTKSELDIYTEIYKMLYSSIKS